MRFLEFTSLKADAGATKATRAATETPGALAKTAQNLLAHIPGEASGLYLMAVDAIEKPTTGNLAFVCALSFALLLLVRWVAKASWAVMLTSIGAFAIWMLVLEKGFLHALVPDLLPSPLGLILAVFYSAAITILANAGKIK